MPFLRNLIKKWLLSRNIILSRPPGQFTITPIKLRQMRQRGLKVECFVDGGAADGGWTREFKEIYPDAQALCIEPRQEVQPQLQQLASEMPKIHIAKTLLGAST